MTASRDMCRRARAMLAVLGCACLVLFIRVAHIQTYARAFYIDNARHPGTSTQVLDGARGRITDRHLYPLAQTVAFVRVEASPKAIRERTLKARGVKSEQVRQTDLQRVGRIRQAAQVIGATLGLDEREVLRKLCEPRVRMVEDKKRPGRLVKVVETHQAAEHVVIAQQVRPEYVQRLRETLSELKFGGLSYKHITRRYYPAGPLAANALGYCRIPDDPLSPALPAKGIELLYASVTAGQSVAIRQPFDAWGRRIMRRDMGERPRALPGKDLVLTIDMGTQEIVEEELNRCCELRDPVGANVTVIGVQTGEILAVSCRPNFDPNDLKPHVVKAEPGKKPPDPLEHTRNRITNLPMDPGSTFKILTVAAALEAGVISEHSVFHCPGTRQVGGHPLGCWGKYRHKGHGSQTPAQVLANSCNLAAAEIALRLDPKWFCEFLRRCGIGQVTHSGLAEEHPGRLRNPETMRERDIACLGFGQGVQVSDLQLAVAVSAILNDGIMVQPHVVRSTYDSARGVRYPVEPRAVRRVCSARTSRLVREMMRYVVDQGTGKKAAIDGVAVGGKTATAQIWDADAGRWMDGPRDYVMAFMLAAPVDRRPDFLILVTVERPKVGEHGSEVAAPIARRVAEHLLRQPELFKLPDQRESPDPDRPPV